MTRESHTSPIKIFLSMAFRLTHSSPKAAAATPRLDGLHVRPSLYRLKLYLVPALLSASLLLLAGETPLRRPLPDTGESFSRLMQAGRFENALAHLDRHLETNPWDIDRSMDRLRCLRQLGRYHEAAESACLLLEEHPGRRDLKDLAGDCLLAVFDAAGAVEAWAPLLSDPRWGSRALEKSARALLASGQVGRAADLLWAGLPIGASSSDEFLRLLVQALPSGEMRLSALQELVIRHPESHVYRGELRLAESLRGLTPYLASGDGFPYRTRVRSVWGEPSLEVVLQGDDTAWMGFDTGAGVLLSRTTARDLGIEPIARVPYIGLGERKGGTTSATLLDALEIGGLTLANLPSRIGMEEKRHLDRRSGAIGLSPFKDYVVLYDRRGGLFEIHPEGTSPAGLLGEEGYTLPILWLQGSPAIPVKLQGEEWVPFLLATGAPDTILDVDGAARFGIRPNTGKYRSVPARGMSGPFTMGVADLVSLELAGENASFRNIYLEEVPSLSGVPLYGILGRDVLKKFRMVFDGPASTVTLAAYDR